MIRVIGAVLIVAATSAIGVRGIVKLRGHVRSLESIIASLDVMEGEICSHLTPMREVLEMLSKDSPLPCRKLFANASEGMKQIGRMSFYSIWRSAAIDTRDLTLKPEEREALAELGLCLGRYDIREQAEMIGRVRRRMETYLKRAEEERDRDSKLHAFFGVAAGLFAVTILL